MYKQCILVLLLYLMAMKVFQQPKMLPIYIEQEWSVARFFFHQTDDLLHEKGRVSFVQSEQSTFSEADWQPLEAIGLQVFHSEGNANVLIAEKAVEVACVKDTIVVADDANISVLLISRSDSCSRRLNFSPEAKFGGYSSAWDISEIKQKLGTDVSHLMLFCHAVLGCETTSHIYGIGKGRAV